MECNKGNNGFENAYVERTGQMKYDFVFLNACREW